MPSLDFSKKKKEQYRNIVLRKLNFYDPVGLKPFQWETSGIQLLKES